MLDAKVREIDGITFRYQPMTATPARKLFDELVQRFGPAIGNALGGLDDISQLPSGEELQADLGSVSTALGVGIKDFSKALDSTFHKKLVDLLGEKTEVQNEKGFVPFDHDTREVMFGTKLATEMKWIVFCLEVQFSDFLDLLQGIIKSVTPDKGAAA